MFLAEEAAAATTSSVSVFDFIMLIFTALIVIGFVRLIMARPKKNIFAIAFTGVAAVVFLFVDYIMITKTWFG